MKKNFKNLIFIFLIIFSIHSHANSENDKLKIGVLVPLSGDNKKIGKH